jgi:hypothetical protein
VAGGKQGRSDTDFHPVRTDGANHSEELDDVSELVGERNILGGNMADPFDRDFGEFRKESVGKEAEDGGFVGGIDAVDIQPVVGFRVAEILGLL